VPNQWPRASSFEEVGATVRGICGVSRRAAIARNTEEDPPNAHDEGTFREECTEYGAEEGSTAGDLRLAELPRHLRAGAGAGVGHRAQFGAPEAALRGLRQRVKTGCRRKSRSEITIPTIRTQILQERESLYVAGGIEQGWPIQLL